MSFQIDISEIMDLFVSIRNALPAVLGFFPLAVSAGDPGLELRAPLGIVGLASSTVLNLLVVPAAFSLGFSRKNRRIVDEVHLQNSCKTTTF